MHVVSGPVRYFFLRKSRGREDIHNWPPATDPLTGPDNRICDAIQIFPAAGCWRAQPVDAPDSSQDQAEAPVLLSRKTVLGLTNNEHRGKAEVELVGVRVVNRDGKGEEYVTHLVVAALPGSGLGGRHPRIVPVDRMVFGEYIEYRDQAIARLDLRCSPADYASFPEYLPDEVILPLAVNALDTAILSQRARHAITVEVEAGRAAIHGRAEIGTVGEQASSALLQTPGVVEVADHLIYDEQLRDQVLEALAAKGLDSVVVLTEHGIVSLRGETTDRATSYRIEDIARRIPGVRNVVNDLRIASATP